MHAFNNNARTNNLSVFLRGRVFDCIHLVSFDFTEVKSCDNMSNHPSSPIPGHPRLLPLEWGCVVVFGERHIRCSELCPFIWLSVERSTPAISIRPVILWLASPQAISGGCSGVGVGCTASWLFWEFLSALVVLHNLRQHSHVYSENLCLRLWYPTIFNNIFLRFSPLFFFQHKTKGPHFWDPLNICMVWLSLTHTHLFAGSRRSKYYEYYSSRRPWSQQHRMRAQQRPKPSGLQK